MTAVEITLLLIGVIFMLGSFLIQERFSQRDIKRISEMSEKELRIVVDKQLKSMEAQVEDSVNSAMNDAMEISKRAMERVSNEKIMMMDEYSKTVLDSMKKTNKDNMFLYDMLIEKHKELTALSGELQQFPKRMRSMADEVLDRLDDAAGEAERRIRASAAEALGDSEELPLPVFEPLEPVKEPLEVSEAKEKIIPIPKSGAPAVGIVPSEANQNEKILSLHRQGLDDVDIAKQLGCGLGEVKLVIGLYKGEVAT